MLSEDYTMATHDSKTFLIQVGDDGLLTISMPEMIGRPVLVEQRDGRLIISPFDVETQCGDGAIARHGNHWTMLGLQGRGAPLA